MILATYEKQPAEVKDYDIDYTQWLSPAEDVLDGVTAVVSSTAETSPTLVVDLVQHTVYVAKIWLSGGTPGVRYKVTVQAQTVGGRLDESELIFNVKDR